MGRYVGRIMNLLEQYRELIKFHVLTCDKDLTRMTHAAADEDGRIFVYNRAPVPNDTVENTVISDFNFWVCDESDPQNLESIYFAVGKVEVPEELNMYDLIIEL